MMPGLLAMFSLKGWMVLLWGIALLPLGFAILAVALFKTRAIPRWQSACFLAGVLLVAFPDGAEIINLTASILMAVALVPYGMRMLARQGSARSAAAPARESLRVLEALPADRRRRSALATSVLLDLPPQVADRPSSSSRSAPTPAGPGAWTDTAPSARVARVTTMTVPQLDRGVGPCLVRTKG